MKKQTIIQMYYFTMFRNIFSLICAIIAGVLLVVYSNEFVKSVGVFWGFVLISIVIIAIAIFIVMSYKKIFVLLKDREDLKDKKYISITAKVVGFKKNRDVESGVQINNNPIVTSLETNEKIMLIINDNLLIDEICEFHYLKNSKIAEISKRI